MDEIKAGQGVRHRIMYAYLELLRKKEADQISITQLTKAAGVSRMAFYRQFDSKRDVVDFYFGGMMRWEVAWDREKGRERSIWDPDFGIRFFQVMKEHRETILLLTQRGYASVLLRVINMTNENVAGDMPHHSIERYDLYFLAGAGFNAMMIWLMTGCKETPEEMAGALARHIRIDK